MSGDIVTVIDSAANCPDLPIVQGEGKAKAVVWPGTGARFRTFQIIELRTGSRTIPLSHRSDAAYYVMQGAGEILDLGTGARNDLGEGAMVHIDADDRYQFLAGSSGLMLLGGPCPADESLYAGLSL